MRTIIIVILIIAFIYHLVFILAVEDKFFFNELLNDSVLNCLKKRDDSLYKRLNEYIMGLDIEKKNFYKLIICRIIIFTLCIFVYISFIEPYINKFNN